MSASTQASDPPELGAKAVRAVVAGLMTGVFLSALDGMIMATALRTIADSLHGLTSQAAVTTGYLITMTISAPLYGKLSDLFGRKRLYLVAIGIFLVGSVLCATAQSIVQLAVFRGVQGLGGGGLAGLALAAMADLFPPERRIRYQANVGLVYGVASVAGPVLGGLFAGVDQFLGVAGWRWIFLVNVPVAIVAGLVIGLLYPATAPRGRRRIDYWGGALLTGCLVPLVLVAEQGREWGWLSGRALLLYGAGLLALVAFLAVQRALGDDALLPPSLFRVSAFAKVNVVNFLGGVGMFTALAFIPLYLQIVKGMSPTAAGLLLLPQSLATTAGAKLCGPVLARTGNRYPLLLVPGLLVIAASYGAFALCGPATPVWRLVGLVLVMGLGLGVFMQTVLAAMQNSVPPSHLGVASGLYGFSRQVGGIAGTAALLSVLFGTATASILDRYDAAVADGRVSAALADPAVRDDPADRAVLDGLAAGTAGIDLDDSSALSTVDPRVAEPVLAGLDDAMSIVFLLLAALVALAAVLALTIREKRPAPAAGAQAVAAPSGAPASTGRPPASPTSGASPGASGPAAPAGSAPGASPGAAGPGHRPSAVATPGALPGAPESDGRPQ